MRRLVEIIFLCCSCLMLGMSAALAAEASLDIHVEALSRQWSRAALLAHPNARTITVADDVAYHRSMQYRAIPLRDLIGDTSQLAVIKFVASDGFVANIPGKLLASNGEPWLAVEASDAPWPALRAGGPSAGPFYLVWLAPAKAGVSPEQWPYQIAKIEHTSSLADRYPQLIPKVADGTPAARGLHVFLANCASCHQINGGGDANVGPDLNRPFSPTEYFQESFLRRLIRDPASVRNWQQRIMPGFSSEAINDSQLDDLLAYLGQMAKQR